METALKSPVATKNDVQRVLEFIEDMGRRLADRRQRTLKYMEFSKRLRLRELQVSEQLFLKELDRKLTIDWIKSRPDSRQQWLRLSWLTDRAILKLRLKMIRKRRDYLKWRYRDLFSSHRW